MTARARVRRDDGYAAIVVAACTALILLPICAFSVDIARLYVEAERLQSAADAAAAAGVTYLPDNLDGAEDAAVSVARRNGYPGTGTSEIDVAVGEKPTQLRVSISSTVHNSFAAAFGLDFATVSRTALADYNGPAPMGSPCNTFGNEPPGTPARPPVGSQLSVPPGGAGCSTNPQFWAAVAGPNTPKGNGDQFMTRSCASGNSGCTGTTNTEMKPNGYFYTVRATEAAVGRTVRLQLYDPVFAEVGDACTEAPTGNVNNNAWNSYASTDAIARYARSAGAYCPGDVLNGGSTPVVTSFGLRRPTDTYDPLRAPPIAECGRQYPGYLKSQISANTLRSTHGSYNDSLARSFRQWVTMCQFTVTQAGDYYLQVRTNVPAATGPIGLDGGRASTGVYTQTDDNTAVQASGNNRFAMRVIDAPAGSMSIAGYQSMSQYMNYAGASANFNLVRVIPAAQTKSLVVSFFDVGDASAPGEITILPPTDSNLPASVQGCVGAGPRNGAIANCKLTNVSSGAGFNGRTQTVSVPIPPDYNCNVAQPGGCWFRVNFAFPGSVPNDTTTWSAQISGDPVRLIE